MTNIREVRRQMNWYGQPQMESMVVRAVGMQRTTHLTSRINDMTIVFDALVHHTFSESRFDRRVIGVHEVVLHDSVSIHCDKGQVLAPQ